MFYDSKEINRVIDYIEGHLDEPLEVETLARVGGYSPFHFSRLFKSMTGESLGAMVKRLRLEQGARQLYNITQNITDVGMQSGYNTPSSFTKAFKQRFDHSPTHYKAQLKAQFEQFFSSLTLQPEVKRFPVSRLLCCRATGDYTQSALEAWEGLYAQGETATHLGDTSRYYGLCYDIPGMTDEQKIRYEACISVPPDTVTTNPRLFTRDLPAGSYATMTYEGAHEGLYDAWPMFYGWVQSQQLTLANFAPVERYHDDPAQMLESMPDTPRTQLKLLLGE